MAEIALDWHMLFFFFVFFFANEESNCIRKKLGLAFFCANKFHFTHCFVEAVKQETTAFVADTSPNRKQFPWHKICGSMELDTGNYLTQLASVGFHDFASLPGSGKICTK